MKVLILAISIFIASTAFPQSVLWKPTPITFDKHGMVDVPFTMIMTSFDLLMAADLATTRNGIDHGFGTEGNGLMSGAVNHRPWDIIIKGTVTLGLNWLMKYGHELNPVAGWIFVGVIDVLMSAVVYHNYRISVGL